MLVLQLLSFLVVIVALDAYVEFNEKTTQNQQLAKFPEELKEVKNDKARLESTIGNPIVHSFLLKVVLF